MTIDKVKIVICIPKEKNAEKGFSPVVYIRFFPTPPPQGMKNIVIISQRVNNKVSTLLRLNIVKVATYLYN